MQSSHFFTFFSVQVNNLWEFSNSLITSMTLCCLISSIPPSQQILKAYVSRYNIPRKCQLLKIFFRKMLKFTQKQHLQLNKNKLNEWKLTWNFSNYIPKCVFCAYFRNLILKMKTEKIFSWYIFVHICLIKMSYLWSTASKSTKKLLGKRKNWKYLMICAT